MQKKAVIDSGCYYHYCQNEASFSHAYRPDRFHLTEVLANVLKEYAGRYGIEKETQERIRRMVWVSLMECVKAGSKTNRRGSAQNGKETDRKLL